MKRKEKRCCKPLKGTLIAAILFVFAGVLGFSFTSYAWLSDSVQAPASKVEGAHYAIEISLTNNGEALVGTTTNEGSVYALEASTEYVVKLTASGTASTGFAIFTANGESYYSKQLKPNETADITVITGESGVTLVVDYQWGSAAVSEDERIGKLDFAIKGTED